MDSLLSLARMSSVSLARTVLAGRPMMIVLALFCTQEGSRLEVRCVGAIDWTALASRGPRSALDPHPHPCVHSLLPAGHSASVCVFTRGLQLLECEGHPDPTPEGVFHLLPLSRSPSPPCLLCCGHPTLAGSQRPALERRLGWLRRPHEASSLAGRGPRAALQLLAGRPTLRGSRRRLGRGIARRCQRGSRASGATRPPPCLEPFNQDAEQQLASGCQRPPATAAARRRKLRRAVQLRGRADEPHRVDPGQAGPLEVVRSHRARPHRPIARTQGADATAPSDGYGTQMQSAGGLRSEGRAAPRRTL